MARVFRADAVGAFDEGGIERDDVHQHAEAEFLLQQTLGDFRISEDSRSRIEEEFDWIVAGLAVDIDGAGEIGRAANHPANSNR